MTRWAQYQIVGTLPSYRAVCNITKDAIRAIVPYTVSDPFSSRSAKQADAENSVKKSIG